MPLLAKEIFVPDEWLFILFIRLKLIHGVCKTNIARSIDIIKLKFQIPDVMEPLLLFKHIHTDRIASPNYMRSVRDNLLKINM
jgi:hypothetical protein